MVSSGLIVVSSGLVVVSSGLVVVSSCLVVVSSGLVVVSSGLQWSCCGPQVLERSIKLLFESRDLSQVKVFVQRQLLKVLEGSASMQDLTFAKEYRGSGSYRPGACIPALELSR